MKFLGKGKLIRILLLVAFIFLGTGRHLVFAAFSNIHNNEEADEAYTKACMLLESGLYEQAKLGFAKVLEIDPTHRGALNKIMEVQKKILEGKKGASAAKEESQGGLTGSASLEKDYMFATEFLGRKNYVKAKYYLTRIVKVNPRYKGAGPLLKDVLLLMNIEKQRAVENQRKEEAARNKEFLEENYDLALQFFKKKNYAESRNYLLKVAQINPQYRNTASFFADLALAQGLEKEENRMDSYTLGPGDVIQLYVKDNDDMNREVKIQPAGEFVLPSVNEIIMVNNMPKEELDALVKEKLKKYFKDPQVQLVVKEYASKKWYVLGEVRSNGAYKIGKPNITLLEALYAAGLPIENKAAMRRAQLIHPDKYRPIIRDVNIYALLYEGNLSQNVILRPGDIVYVPKLGLSKLTELVTLMAAPTAPVRKAMEDIEAINTITPLTRVGSGPGQIY
ncbi:MAG: polysaccharide biosynthesis/export family protein [Candidatus Omnitrophota bacterium]